MPWTDRQIENGVVGTLREVQAPLPEIAWWALERVNQGLGAKAGRSLFLDLSGNGGGLRVHSDSRALDS